MTLVCEEEATFRQGTDTIADHQTVMAQSVISRSDISIGPGQPFEERCVLTVPEAAMHSFRSINNSISWTLTVHAKVAKRPDYERNFSVIVVPCTNGEDPQQ